MIEDEIAERQRHGERAARPRLALDGELTSVGGNDPVRDRQSESKTTVLATESAMPKAAPFSPLRLFSPVMLVFCFVLFFLPWIDRSPVRSTNYRPMYRWFFWVLVADVFVLGYLGQAEPTATVVTLSQLCAAYYFSHFLIILPLISAFETPLPLPDSISSSSDRPWARSTSTSVLKTKLSAGAL